MYRGEIQNDSIGGNYNRSLDYSPSVGGLGAIGRDETRNFAVGAPLRGRGENEEMEDDPCWDGYEMIGTKMKKGREVPNCVPVGGDEPPRVEVPNMSDFIRLMSFGNKEFAGKLEKSLYGEGKPFTKEQLTKIILDKNKVIADLEENAYGGDWGADFEKMIDEHNRNNQAQLFNGEGGGWQEEMFSPEEIAETEKKWQEYLEKNPMVKGEGFWEDVRKGVVKHNERKKITPISKEDWKKQMEDFKAPTESWGADELGGAAAKVEPKAPSGVAAAAEALQPVRTAIQNKVGDLIYGAETDPRKQKKGLLGISEEGKEESKKKVMKNIVKPLIDGWNQLFNPDKVKEQNLAKHEAAVKRAAAKAGWLYELPDGEYDVTAYKNPGAKLVRQPRHYHRWVQKNAKYNTGYYIDDYDEGSIPYIKIPNPIKGLKANYTAEELKKNNIPYFVPVDRVNATTDNENRWQIGFEGDEIWVPQDIGSKVYQALNQYKAKMEEEKERAYYESLSPVEKQEYRENKAIEKDTGMTEAAKAKVAKDIADEEAKENPDTERLAKMKAAQERVRVKGVENFQKSATQTKKVSERKYKEQMAREAAERQAAEAKEQADAAESWKAMTPAERTIQLDAYRKDLQEQGWSEEAIEDAVSQLGEDQSALMVGRMGGGFFGDIFKQADKEAKEKWDKLSPEEKLRAEIRQNVRVHQGQAGFFNKRHYEKLAKLEADYESDLARRIASAKEMGRPVNESAIAALRASRRKATEDFAKEMAALGGAKKGEAGEAKRRVEVEIPQRQLDRMEEEEAGDAEKIAFADAVTEYTLKDGDEFIVENHKAGTGWGFEKSRYVWDGESGKMIGFLGDDVFYDLAKEVRKKEKWDFQVPKPDTSEMTELRDRREAIEKTLPKAVRDKLKSPVSAGDAARAQFRAALEAAGIPVIKGSTQINFQLAAKSGKGEPDDGELVGEGAIEFTLAKAGMALYNPTRDMTKAGIQTFTPEYDAYGATVEQGRENAFNLSRSMYNQQQAIELPDFDLIEDNTSLRFYLKDDEDVILVGIRGTDVKSWTDLYTWAVIGAKQDFRMTTRFQDDLHKLLVFQKQYPLQQYYYVAAGSSLAGSIADRFLDMGLISEAITYNPSIEQKYILNSNIHNHRVYLDTDPLFILMGQYAPNTEIRKNAGRAEFFNPLKEKDYLIKSHSIFPVYNPAFEGGGMMGAGKTYTIEEWKAIFDAKLEQKRQQIEAREAKKKQTAKAKRERAKARRDGRDEPPPLETPATFRPSRVMKATPPKAPEPEPEDSGEDVEMTKYRVDGKYYYVDDAREGVAFDARVVMDMEDNELGTLGDFREIAKAVFNKEKPKAPRKPRLKVVAPASARVELREELVAAQPREPEGEFASEAAEPLQLVVAEIERQPQRAYMMMMKSPKLTESDRRLMMNLHRSSMSPMKKVKLLARSGLARKVMEMLGIDESAFQTPRARLRIADTMEKRTTAVKVREIVLPDDIEAVFKAQEEGLISYVAERITKKKGMGESLFTMVKYTDTFAKCGFGCLGLTAKCMAADPFDLYYSSEMNSDLNPQDKAGEKSLGLMMALTQADENYMSQVGFWTKETRADTSMSFGRVNHERFLLPRLTDVCMGRLGGIAGIDRVSDTTRNAGMGYKRRNEWRVSFTGVYEVKKWTEAVKTQYTAKIKSEIVPKIMAIAADLKPKMLARGEAMKERLEASLTAEQKKELADYRGVKDEEKRKKDAETARLDAVLAKTRAKVNKFKVANDKWNALVEGVKPLTEAQLKTLEPLKSGYSPGMLDTAFGLLNRGMYFQKQFRADCFDGRANRKKRFFIDALGNTVFFQLEWQERVHRIMDAGAKGEYTWAKVEENLDRRYESVVSTIDDLEKLMTTKPHHTPSSYLSMRITGIERPDGSKVMREGRSWPNDLADFIEERTFSLKELKEGELDFYGKMATRVMRLRQTPAGRYVRPVNVELRTLIREFGEFSYMKPDSVLFGDKGGDWQAADDLFANWAFGTSWQFQ